MTRSRSACAKVMMIQGRVGSVAGRDRMMMPIRVQLRMWASEILRTTLGGRYDCSRRWIEAVVRRNDQ